MRWPFLGKDSPRESFAIGRYKLDGFIEGLGGLIEFSPNEYAAMGRQFVGEKDYNALPVAFLGRSWEVMIQAVHGRICAIAPYLVEADRREAETVFAQTRHFCIEQLGKPTKQEATSALWRAADGTVLLKSETTADAFRIGLFLTSSAVRHFQRL